MLTVKEELAELLSLWSRLKPGGGLTMRRSGKDITARERAILAAEIRHLESILKRSSAAQP